MKLNLAISGKILASVPVDPFEEKDDYYLKAFRRMLIIRCSNRLKTLSSEPQFYLEQNVPAKQVAAN